MKPANFTENHTAISLHEITISAGSYAYPVCDLLTELVVLVRLERATVLPNGYSGPRAAVHRIVFFWLHAGSGLLLNKGLNIYVP